MDDSTCFFVELLSGLCVTNMLLFFPFNALSVDIVIESYCLQFRTVSSMVRTVQIIIICLAMLHRHNYCGMDGAEGFHGII